MDSPEVPSCHSGEGVLTSAVPAPIRVHHTQAVAPHDLALTVKQIARDLGFDLVGIADIGPSSHAAYIESFFGQKRHGTMDYLARMKSAKMDIQTHLPWVRSAVCVAISYHQGNKGSHGQSGANAVAKISPSTPHAGRDSPSGNENVEGDVTAKIATYAAGRDYHRIFTGLLQKLERAIRALVPGDLATRAYVDTGPCLERELATRAGLGWIGKNTMLIHPKHGSWFLLGELFLSLALPADPPQLDRCGTCTRCIEACPTDALSPYQMNAGKCISYLTLENRADIGPEFHAPMREAGYIIGCDICQTVCPFNRHPLVASHPDFQPRTFSGAVSLRTVLNWTEHDWDQATRGRAFRRAKYHMWRRNASIVGFVSLYSPMCHQHEPVTTP